uniref:FERM domain-containing protein n=2 Tax=Acrobeloides nanus TaxID=290746 RepID=A0A914EL66_9BILA
MIPVEKRKRSAMIKNIQNAIRSEQIISQSALELKFLDLCWHKNVYGCTTFRATMYMSRPPFNGITEVYVGLNDWGLIVINAKKFSILLNIPLKHVVARYEMKPHIEIIGRDNRNVEYVFTLATKQAQLINNLLKQIKNKKEATRN